MMILIEITAIHQKKNKQTKFKGYKLNKYFISAYINNKIEFIHIGKQIKQNYQNISLTRITTSVSIEEVIIGANPLIMIKVYSNQRMGPKIDVDSGIEWYNWLKNNQPFYGRLL
jgi:hypothetical protein